MNQMSPGKVAIAASAFACAALLSFGWSEQRGVSLSVESAQARIGRPLTPMSVAGVARRQARRGAYYGAGVAGAAAVGAAGAVAAAPYYYGRGAYYGGAPYYGAGAGPYAAYGGYGMWGQDYATRNNFSCRPGTMTKLDDGRMYRCQ